MARGTLEDEAKEMAARIVELEARLVDANFGRAAAENASVADMYKRQDAEKRVVELEERVSHAEIARDNAITMRDEVMAQKKQAGESAGRRIEALIRLGRHYAKGVEVLVPNVMELFEHDLAAILEKNAPDSTPVKASDLVRRFCVEHGEHAGTRCPECVAARRKSTIAASVSGDDPKMVADVVATAKHVLDSLPPPSEVERRCELCGLPVDACSCVKCGGCNEMKDEGECRYLPKARMWLCKACDTPPTSLTDRIVTLKATLDAMRSEYALKNNMSVEDVVIIDGKPEYRPKKDAPSSTKGPK